MTSKERVIKALNHEITDRVPLDGIWRPDSWAILEDHFQTEDTETIKDELGLDFRFTIYEPSDEWAAKAEPAEIQIPEIGMGRQNLVIPRDNQELEDEYGIRRRMNDTKMYWLYSYHPLEEASLEEVKDYQLPDPSDPARYKTVERELAEWGGKYFTTLELWNLFKSCWELRGFETFMLDMAMNPELVEVLADKFLVHHIEESKQLVRRGVDMIFVLGDVAMQDAMMFSPKMWRDIFKPRLKHWIDEVKKEKDDTYFMFHSDGNNLAVFDDLIEIGFHAVDPVQPECLDVEKVKDEFGDRVCLHGTISLQETLPFGTPDDVRNEVKHRVSYCGRGGGLILAPSNVVQPDVSAENIVTLYKTAQEMPVEA